jgi:hypothetical protein
MDSIRKIRMVTDNNRTGRINKRRMIKASIGKYNLHYHFQVGKQEFVWVSRMYCGREPESCPRLPALLRVNFGKTYGATFSRA